MIVGLKHEGGAQNSQLGDHSPQDGLVADCHIQGIHLNSFHGRLDVPQLRAGVDFNLDATVCLGGDLLSDSLHRQMVGCCRAVAVAQLQSNGLLIIAASRPRKLSRHIGSRCARTTAAASRKGEGHDAGQDERSQLFHLFFLRFFIDSFSGKDRCFEQKHFS